LLRGLGARNRLSKERRRSYNTARYYKKLTNTTLLSRSKKSIRNRGLYIRFNAIRSTSIALVVKLNSKPIEALLRVLGRVWASVLL